MFFKQFLLSLNCLFCSNITSKKKVVNQCDNPRNELDLKNEIWPWKRPKIIFHRYFPKICLTIWKPFPKLFNDFKGITKLERKARSCKKPNKSNPTFLQAPWLWNRKKMWTRWLKKEKIAQKPKQIQYLFWISFCCFPFLKHCWKPYINAIRS